MIWSFKLMDLLIDDWGSKLFDATLVECKLFFFRGMLLSQTLRVESREEIISWFRCAVSFFTVLFFKRILFLFIEIFGSEVIFFVTWINEEVRLTVIAIKL